MAFNLEEYKELYIKTARDLLYLLKHHFANVQARTATELDLKECHRAVHSLKSQSLVMGYTHTGTLAKQMELIFRKAVEGMILDSPTIEILDGAIRSCEDSIESIAQGQMESDLGHITQVLSSATISSPHP